MTKRVFLFPVIILLLAVTSCNTIKVTADYDKEVDFKSFKTFTLLPWNAHNDSIVSTFTKQRILEALKNEMIKRGYYYVADINKADLGVNSYVLLREKTDYQYYQDYYGPYGYYYTAPWAWGGYYGYPYNTTVQSRDYIEGTLIIDVFDTHKKKLIWQGIGVGEVEPNGNGKHVAKAISQIFFKYPVKFK
jgi:hypothetical protein